MRLLTVVLLSLFGFAHHATAQTVACTAGARTTISGVVYAPNGVDPLPNVLVFVPTVTPDAFAPGVSCPAPGTPPSGQPTVGSTTAVDGSFTILDAPVGTQIPLVIQTGRWRRQFVISTVTACVDNPQTGLRMPRNKSEGDIPKFAISTGASDQVECVLRKVGIDDAEFTNPGGTGRINLYQASGAPGARIDTTTPKQAALMGDLPTLESYDVLMLPCEGDTFTEPAAQLANLVSFANAGGRVYTSHFGYEWLSTNVPFNTVANWSTNQNISPDPGVATIDQSFSDGQTLAQWLQLVGATTTVGQMPISTLRKNFTSVNPPTQSYMTLNNTTYGNPVMQFVFDAPLGAAINQCGRVLFDEYHVENPPSLPTNLKFPVECSTTSALTPQEKLLEFSVFELTSDGAAATLTPTTQDFGSEPIGFTSNPQTFTWTNNSTFPSGVTLLTATGDFAVTGNHCSAVAAGKSCQITVAFTPTVLGARTGVLTVGSPGSTLTSTLTGTGTPALTVSASSQDFGNVDVGAHVTRTDVSVVNQAPAALPLPSLTLSGTAAGDYVVTNGCNGVVPALQTCALTVIFTPLTTGARPATLTVNAAGAPQTVSLTGTGVDFSVAAAPTSGSVIAGYGTGFTFSTTPIAGFTAPLSLSCSSNLPASTCTLSATSVTSPSPASFKVTVTTTSQYTVVGYGAGLGSTWMLCVLGVGSAGLLWFRRKETGTLLRGGLLLMMVGVVGISLTGCSSLLPAKNAAYTPPGDYTVTVTATDGFLSHSATYALHVTAK